MLVGERNRVRLVCLECWASLTVLDLPYPDISDGANAGRLSCL